MDAQSIIKRYKLIFYNPKIVRLLSLIHDDHFADDDDPASTNPFNVVAKDSSLRLLYSQRRDFTPPSKKETYDMPYKFIKPPVVALSPTSAIHTKDDLKNAFLATFFVATKSNMGPDFPNALAFVKKQSSKTYESVVPMYRIVNALENAPNNEELLRYLPSQTGDFDALQHNIEMLLRVFHAYMMSAEKTLAFLRIRCDTPTQHEQNVIAVEGLLPTDILHRGTSIQVVDTTKKIARYEYGPFDAVFMPSASNSAIAEELRETLLNELKMHPVVLIAYGPSGSGKTSTLIQFDKEDGVAFMLAPIADGGITYTEYLDDSTKKEYKNLRSATEVQNKLLTDRNTSATPNNPASSRSHVIVKLQFRDIRHPLYVCDFAGIEAKFDCTDWHVSIRLQFMNWMNDPNKNVTEQDKNDAIHVMEQFGEKEHFMMFVKQPFRHLCDMFRGCIFSVKSLIKGSSPEDLLKIADKKNMTDSTSYKVNRNPTTYIKHESNDQKAFYESMSPDFKEFVLNTLKKEGMHLAGVVLTDDGRLFKERLHHYVLDSKYNGEMRELLQKISLPENVQKLLKANQTNTAANEVCDKLNKEGTYIRETLGDLNHLIARLYDLRSEGAVYPAPPFDDICFSAYCDPRPLNCFPIPKKKPQSTPNTPLIADLQAVLSPAATVGQVPGVFALFGVVNVSSDKAPTFAYLTTTTQPTTDLKKLFPSSDWKGLDRGGLASFNAPSLRGSLDFMQRCITFMQTDQVCPIHPNYSKILGEFIDVKKFEPVPDVHPLSGQEGGGVVYAAVGEELVRWAAVATVGAGLSLLVARRWLRVAPGRSRDLPTAILASGVAYSLATILLSAVAGLDTDAARAFAATRVALHLSAYWVAVAASHAIARRRPTDPLERHAAALYAAALAAIVIV